MKNFIFLLSLCLMTACTKDSATAEEYSVPTVAEQAMIDEVRAFLGNNGDYEKITDVYRVALRPVLTVRSVLTDGACTDDYFRNDCCCPWKFSLDPYDAVIGGVTNYYYPKTALFTGKPGKMEGSFSAFFEDRPLAANITAARYDHFACSDFYLDGLVSVRNLVISPSSNNPICVAEFDSNSLRRGSSEYASITGHLSFSDGDAGGKLEVVYPDSRKITAEVFTGGGSQAYPYALFRQKGSLTIEGLTAEVDFNKQTVTIGDRIFRVLLW